MLPSVQELLAGTTGLIGEFYSCAHTMNLTLQSSLSQPSHIDRQLHHRSPLTSCTKSQMQADLDTVRQDHEKLRELLTRQKFSICSNVYRITKNTFKLFILK